MVSTKTLLLKHYYRRQGILAEHVPKFFDKIKAGELTLRRWPCSSSESLDAKSSADAEEIDLAFRVGALAERVFQCQLVLVIRQGVSQGVHL